MQKRYLLITIAASLLALPPLVLAQAAAPAPATAEELPWASAEVRRIDTAAGKISLRHGEIKNLDMPPMTMVFQVREPASLTGLAVGDQVRFIATQLQGAYTVLRIEKAP